MMLGEYDAGYENCIDSMVRQMEDMQFRIDNLHAENAKLRELVRHMHACMEHYEQDGSISCDRCPLDNDTQDCDYEQRMRELGIEVDA